MAIMGEPSSGEYWERADFDGDGKIGYGDFLALLRHWNARRKTDWVDQLIADSWGAQDARPAGVPIYYAYANTPYHQEDVIPSNKTAVCPWIQVIGAAGEPLVVQNARFQWRHWRCALYGSAWSKVLEQDSGSFWAEVYSPTYGPAPAGASKSFRAEPDGGWSWKPTAGALYHATPGSHPLAPQGSRYAVAVDVRIIADDPSQPFSCAGLIADVGGDWRTSNDSGALPPIVQGAWRRVTAEWRTLYASSVDAATLRANPPPLA